jgi:hypothetical protein
MKGIQYLIDDKGKKTAVVIDLQQWGELWEDFQNILVSRFKVDDFVDNYPKETVQSLSQKEQTEDSPFGRYAGQIKISDDFNDEDEEINNLFGV